MFAQLAKNIENACVKARRYYLAAQRVVVYLRTQTFQDFGREVELSGPTCFPNDIIEGSRYFYTTPDRGIAASLQDLTRLFTGKPACEAWSKGIAGV